MGNIAEQLFAHSPNDIFIPSIVLFELEVGINKSNNPEKRKAQLASLLSQIAIVPFNAHEAQASAAIRASLEQQGTPIGPMDTLIAGCALANNMTLITHNTKEFERVEGLKLEDWF